MTGGARTAFLVAFYGLTLLGLLPAAYFIVTFRPSRFRLAQIDTVLWVVLVFAMMGLGRGLPLLTGHPYEPSTDLQAANVIFITLLVDGAIWVRVWHWRRIRRQFRPAGSRRHWWL